MIASQTLGLSEEATLTAAPAPDWRWAAGLAAAAALTGVLYLAVSALAAGELGYPLDDGWIHQVFARNLAESGQMAYNRDEPAAGSTAPLWTVALAFVRLLPVDPLLSSYALGLLCLAGSGWLAILLWQQLNGGRLGGAAVVAAGLVVLDWHLAWAALSGMETPLFVLLSLAIVYATIRRGPAWQVGLLGGLLTATRPEGIALAGLCWTYAVLGLRVQPADRNAGPSSAPPAAAAWVGRAVRYTLAFAVGLLAPLAPVVYFSYAVSGTVLPNTFYAKSAYYGAGTLEVLGVFLGQAALIIALGPLGFIVPGLVWSGLDTFRRRDRGLLLLWLWPLALIGLYAWRLPATYQHARYVMPALPFLLLLGWQGMVRFPGAARLVLVPKMYVVLLALLLIGSWAYGAVVYGRDVRLITTVQVGAARWLRDNTETSAEIATHDIGAIGYFSGRRIVDTAGLVTPETVPLIRDQARLLAYLRERRVGYVAQFTVWYPQLSTALADKEAYRIHDAGVLAAGGDDFVIYRTGW